MIVNVKAAIRTRFAFKLLSDAMEAENRGDTADETVRTHGPT
jgi:hypothetical protein